MITPANVLAFKLYAYKRLVFIQALRDKRGNLMAVGRELGISRSHVDRLMEQFRLDANNFRLKREA